MAFERSVVLMRRPLLKCMSAALATRRHNLHGKVDDTMQPVGGDTNLC